MNMQALLKQAQNLQRDMMKANEAIYKMEFVGESSFVTVVTNGKKEVLSISIDRSIELGKDDVELLEDILVVAINNAFKKVDDATEQQLGKFKNIPGLF